MSVLGHNDISDDDKHIALSHPLQHFEKQVALARSAEQRLSAIATASDEMKITGAMVAVKVLPHADRIVPREVRSGDGGHRRKVMKKSGGPSQQEATSRKPQGVARLQSFCISIPTPRQTSPVKRAESRARALPLNADTK